VCSRSDGGIEQRAAARRTVRHGQTVIARCSGIQRASVHGCQGTVLKRLAVTARIKPNRSKQQTRHSSTRSQQSEEQWELAAERGVEVWCWASLHASDGGGGAEQGRSRHRTITPVRAAKPSDGPHFKVPRATSICRRLQGIASLRQSVPFHYIRTAMPSTQRACSWQPGRCRLPAAVSGFREVYPTQPAPAPASAVTADLTRVEVLSVALGWATPPSLVAEVNMNGQQMAERLKNDHGGIWVPGPVRTSLPTHASRTGRGCVGVPVSNPTCTCTRAMFEAHHIAMPHVGPAMALHSGTDDEAVLPPPDRLTSKTQRALGRRLRASRHPCALSSGVAGSHRWWLGPPASGRAMASHLHRASEPEPILVQPCLHGSPAPLWNHREGCSCCVLIDRIWQCCIL
jgi:hypothetical protein